MSVNPILGFLDELPGGKGEPARRRKREMCFVCVLNSVMDWVLWNCSCV